MRRNAAASQDHPWVSQSVADAASENTLDEESGKGHWKPGMEAVMVDIIDVVDVVMFNTEYEADIINEANVVRERVNMNAREDRLDKDTIMHDDDEDENNAEILSSQSRTARVSQQSSLLLMLFPRILLMKSLAMARVTGSLG